MGLDTSSFGYHDIYGLDDELLQMVPQPVQAVLLLFPITQQVEQMRIEEDEKVQQRAGAGEGGSLWFKQTVRRSRRRALPILCRRSLTLFWTSIHLAEHPQIGNACGTIGLLHSIANSTARDAVSPSSPLATLLARAAPLDPLARAKLLSESRELETAHSVTASAGQTAAPAATDDVNLHFVCFVRDNNARLVELDGRRRGVLDRGECPTQDDLLKVSVAQ